MCFICDLRETYVGVVGEDCLEDWLDDVDPADTDLDNDNGGLSDLRVGKVEFWLCGTREITYVDLGVVGEDRLDDIDMDNDNGRVSDSRVLIV